LDFFFLPSMAPAGRYSLWSAEGLPSTFGAGNQQLAEQPWGSLQGGGLVGQQLQPGRPAGWWVGGGLCAGRLAGDC
jgi:hypothetical protein